MSDPSYVSVAPLLRLLLDSNTLSQENLAREIAAAIALVPQGKLSDIQCASLLTLLRTTSLDEDAQVIAEVAKIMRAAATQINKPQVLAAFETRKPKEGHYEGGLCDIVGTGGDGHSTFNVSTTASIVASSLLMVAKHGAQASSSKSGSADVLEAISPKGPVIRAVHANSLAEFYRTGNYAFLFAPTFHPGMSHVRPVRKELGFKTIFNLIGPLINPVSDLIEARVYGVFKTSLGRTYAEALRLNGAKKTMVVCGAEDLDEISCAGQTFCWRLVPGTTASEQEIEEFTLEPADFGLPEHPLTEVLPGKLPHENAEILVRMLSNQLLPEDPTLHFVLMNTAALFVVAGICESERSQLGGGDDGKVIRERGPGGGRWKEGVRRARWAIESGAALRALQTYVDTTHAMKEA